MSNTEKKSQNAPEKKMSSSTEFKTDSLLAGLTALFQNQLNAFAKALCAKYPSLSEKDVIEIWNDVSGQLLTVSAPKSAPQRKPRGSSNKASLSGNTCKYKFVKGKRASQECGAGVPNSNIEGTELPRAMCNKHAHRELESTSPVTPKTKTKTKTTTEPESEAESSADATSEAVSQPPVSTPPIRITKDKTTGRFVHKITGLVINKANRKVTCVQLDNGDTRPLTAKDVEVASLYSLKIDPDVKIEEEEEEGLELELEAKK